MISYTPFLLSELYLPKSPSPLPLHTTECLNYPNLRHLLAILTILTLFLPLIPSLIPLIHHLIILSVFGLKGLNMPVYRRPILTTSLVGGQLRNLGPNKQKGR